VLTYPTVSESFLVRAWVTLMLGVEGVSVAEIRGDGGDVGRWRTAPGVKADDLGRKPGASGELAGIDAEIGPAIAAIDEGVVPEIS